MWYNLAAWALFFAGLYVAGAVAEVDQLAALLAPVLGFGAMYGVYCFKENVERQRLYTERTLQRLVEEGQIDPSELDDLRRKLG